MSVHIKTDEHRHQLRSIKHLYIVTLHGRKLIKCFLTNTALFSSNCVVLQSSVISVHVPEAIRSFVLHYSYPRVGYRWGGMG